MIRGKHQHQGGAVTQDQQVGSGQEHPQVRAPAIHVGEHRGQACREADPAPPAEHAGISAQGVAEEPRWPSGIKAFAVGGLRLPFPLGEVVLLAAAAVRRSEQGPAVGGDLQRRLQRVQGGVQGPWGVGSHVGGWMHVQRSQVLAVATKTVEACVAE